LHNTVWYALFRKKINSPEKIIPLKNGNNTNKSKELRKIEKEKCELGIKNDRSEYYIF